MDAVNFLKKFWNFLREDSWQSWIVSLILAFVIIKLIFFPLLSFLLATPLPLVVVESCSMYHGSDFDSWWEQNGLWYENKKIDKEDFESFHFTNGLNKGDIVLVSGRGDYSVGDVIIFQSSFKYPLIHRIVSDFPLSTKGDKNFDQLSQEMDISDEDVIGKAVLRIPGVGWLKLIFFEALKGNGEKGFCR